MLIDALSLLSPSVALADDGTAQEQAEPVEPDSVEGETASQVVAVDAAQVADFMTWGASVLGLQMVTAAVLLAVLGALVGRELFGGLRP